MTGIECTANIVAVGNKPASLPLAFPNPDQDQQDAAKGL
jgi:hypothetical protein